MKGLIHDSYNVCNIGEVIERKKNHEIHRMRLQSAKPTFLSSHQGKRNLKNITYGSNSNGNS
jgi:hypothetical protein